MCLAWKNRLYVKLFGEAARTGRVSAWVLVVGYIRIRFVVLLCTQSILISTALYKAEGKRERESSYRVALYEPGYGNGHRIDCGSAASLFPSPVGMSIAFLVFFCRLALDVGIAISGSDLSREYSLIFSSGSHLYSQKLYQGL